MRHLPALVGLSLGLALTPSLTHAATDPDVRRAIEIFDKSRFKQARAQLTVLVDRQGLSQGDRAEARLYLAAAHHLLREPDAARIQLEILFRTSPEIEVDPALFLPEFVSMADAVRRDLEAQSAKKPSTSTPSPDGLQQRVEPSLGPRLELSGFALADVTARSLGGGVAVGAGGESWRAAVDVLLGRGVGVGLEGAYVLRAGPLRPELGARAMWFPTLSSAGGGLHAGARWELGAVSPFVDIGGAYFLTPAGSVVSLVAFGGVRATWGGP
jgi:hypothetical protein